MNEDFDNSVLESDEPLQPITFTLPETTGPARRARILRGLLIALCLSLLLPLASNWLTYNFYLQVQEGVFDDDQALDRAAEKVELIAIVVLGGSLLVYFATAISFCYWLRRAGEISHRLVPGEMKISPGWAIGYFFIPILNFYKPYQAVSEIIRVAKNPSDWRGEHAGSLVSAWWLLWLLNRGLDRVASKLMDKIDDVPSGIWALQISSLSLSLEIVLSLVLFAMVGQITRYQLAYLEPTHEKSKAG